MSKAIDLAKRGRGHVEPNPMVGAVIAQHGKLIGDGWHKQFGGPHAEIEAISATRLSRNGLAGATMYVTLEPCCTQGKTPPCTEAILAAKIARVVVAMVDPDTKVAGAGIAILRKAGLRVDVGLCETSVKQLLGAYVKSRTKRQPWVICKWAQTADGFLALPPGRDRWISNNQSRKHVHELRGLVDGILVGIGTVLADDPMLTNRSGKGNQPTRIVLDSNLRISLDCQLVRTADESPVIVATTLTGIENKAAKATQLQAGGVEVLAIGANRNGQVDLDLLLDELGGRHWTYLLAEGGQQTLASFIQIHQADELMVYVSPKVLGSESVPGLPQLDIAMMPERTRYHKLESRLLGQDRFFRYVLDK